MTKTDRGFAIFSTAVLAAFIFTATAPAATIAPAEHYVSYREAFERDRNQHFDSLIGTMTIIDPNERYDSDANPGLAPACSLETIEDGQGIRRSTTPPACIYLNPGQSVRIDKINRANLGFGFVCVTPVGSSACWWTPSHISTSSASFLPCLCGRRRNRSVIG
jgi:hypothetical protein